ncbi:SPOR domain-containing protein [Psychromonas sp. Urea-02u-13]|uniref:SPOR domain-containing protein n=1 Tax=Psychromonas sp. Urea-02u-13 TaxID=2058326 RepID=UPI000C34B90C|nr:SPOR domain-containing protein [Psychromonas sp. Urea-02u-13]PKG38201.1 cell division protein [Psychromonas sp. Urea-02u-13]
MATPTRRKKGTAAKKNRRTAPQRPKKGNQGFPFLAVIIAILLSAFIGYFMFAVDKPDPVAPVKKQPVKKEELLPEKPQPKWQYEESLPTKEVKVDIPEEEANTRPYQMQCGSFRKQGDAESLKARIAFQGLNSIVKKTGSWYRVILGPYDRKRMAEKERHKLQRAKINGCQIWYWR